MAYRGARWQQPQAPQVVRQAERCIITQPPAIKNQKAVLQAAHAQAGGSHRPAHNKAAKESTQKLPTESQNAHINAVWPRCVQCAEHVQHLLVVTAVQNLVDSSCSSVYQRLTQ